MSVTRIQEKKDIGINLHQMKKIEILVTTEHENFITTLLDKIKVTGFFKIILGKSNDFRVEKIRCNDESSLVMFIAYGNEEIIALTGLRMKELLQNNFAALFVSDIGVARIDYFHAITGV